MSTPLGIRALTEEKSPLIKCFTHQNKAYFNTAYQILLLFVKRNLKLSGIYRHHLFKIQKQCTSHRVHLYVSDDSQNRKVL